MRIGAVLSKTRGSIIVFMSLALIAATTAVALAVQDYIFTYSDSSRTLEASAFGDGDTVYVKVTDTQTTGGTEAITVENNQIGNEISVNVTDSNSDSFYLGYFIVYSGANDDASDKLALFYGQSATITVDLANDGTPGTRTISADYTAPAPSNLTATAIAGGSIRLDWTASSPETNVDWYKIYRSTTSEGQDFNSPLASVSAGTTTYTDSAATVGVTYYYVVRAQDAVGNTDSNTNEVWATAGFSFTVSEVYIRYQDTSLYDLSSSTNRSSPTVFASGKIDEIYLKVTIYTVVPLDESTSTIALYKLVDSETEEVSGTQDIDQDTGTAEMSFDLDPAFNPALDDGTRDGTYWVDITVADTQGNSQDYDYYFVYDTTSPSVPDFQITSYDPSAGSITVTGTTVPDNLSDPTEFYSNPAALLSVVFRTTHVVQSGSPIEVIYTVTEDAAITIRIYNLVGEMVKEWTGSVSLGTENKWTWYGRNMYDQEVNNGTYIFKISAETSGGRHDRKINLLGVAR